ncbi:MAG: beta-galactosidase [Actinomycetes bacterium]
MRFSRVAAIVSVSSILMSGIALAPVQAADDVIPAQVFAMGLAPEETGTPAVPSAYFRLWDMQTSWKDINPAPGQFEWSVLDKRMAQVKKAGAKALLVLGLTPQWAGSSTAGDPRWGVGTASPPADFATYSTYVTEVMKRYGSKISAVEVWNEANLQTFWAGTPDQMADLTQRAQSIIKSISPSTLVLAASTTTRLIGSVKSFFGPYSAALKTRGYPIDAWAIHTYPAANAGPAKRYTDILAWQQVLSNATQADPAALTKQVWDTEINYGLAGPGAIAHADFDAVTSGAFVARTYIDSIRLGIDSTFWYLWTVGNYGLIGVQMHDGTTFTIDPYNRMRQWTFGAVFKGCEDPVEGVVRCFFIKKEPFFIAMSQNDADVSYSKAAALPAQTWSGQELTTAGTITLGVGPVKFTCPGVDKTPCALGANQSNLSSAAQTTSIVIDAMRTANQVNIIGQTSGFDVGASLQSFIKVGNQRKYHRGLAATVDANGGFTWLRNTTKKTMVYFQSGNVKSNVTIIQAR